MLEVGLEGSIGLEESTELEGPIGLEGSVLLAGLASGWLALQSVPLLLSVSCTPFLFSFLSLLPLPIIREPRKDMKKPCCRPA